MDCSFVRELTARFYCRTGRPGIDPVVLVTMALVGYLYGITSERRLAEVCRLNLAGMWFLGDDLDKPTSDHSVLSTARARFGVTTYQAFFTEIVRQCERAGLVQGDRLSAGSTLVRANAGLDSVAALAAQRLAAVEEHVTARWCENGVAPAREAPPAHVVPLPRPQTLPPAISAPNGAWLQAAGSSTGTTSRWLMKSRLGPVPVPASRAIRLPLPGADSSTSPAIPSAASRPRMYSQQGVSFPVGIAPVFTVSKRTVAWWKARMSSRAASTSASKASSRVIRPSHRSVASPRRRRQLRAAGAIAPPAGA